MRRARTSMALLVAAVALVPACRGRAALVLAAPAGFPFAVVAVVDGEGALLSHTEVFAVDAGPAAPLSLSAGRGTSMRALFFGYALDQLVAAGCPGAGCAVTTAPADPPLPVPAPGGAQLTGPFTARAREPLTFAAPERAAETELLDAVRSGLHLGPGGGGSDAGDAGPATDAAPGTDAAAGADAGPGTDAAPATDAAPGTDAGTDAGPPSLCGTFAGELWCDGFETGMLEFPPWATLTAMGPSATWVVDGSTTFRGGSAWHSTVDTTGDYVALLADVPATALTTGTLAFRGYVYKPTSPVVSSELWTWRIQNTAGTGFDVILFNSSGGNNLWLWDDFVDQFEGSATWLTPGTWHCLEVVIALSTTATGSVTLKLDDIPILTRSSIQTTDVAGYGTMRLQVHPTNTDVTQTLYWDELAWATSAIGCE